MYIQSVLTNESPRVIKLSADSRLQALYPTRFYEGTQNTVLLIALTEVPLLVITATKPDRVIVYPSKLTLGTS